MSESLPKPKYFAANVEVELDLPIYAAKADLKNALSIDKSKFAKKGWYSKLKIWGR